ncbi:MAG: hypothetical protein KDD40_03760, partial [Bdellovibrionales bacterium]|nr:hypothetical protein [Bdellovibrionales bacterium]
MLNPALRKLTIISGLVLIMTGCKEPGFQTKANSQLDLSQTHAINDNDNVVNRTISKGDKTRIISVKNKYRSNTLAPATQVTQPKLEKADDFVVKSTSDSEILMYGDHEMLVKPDKIIVDPDDNEIKFRFANSLERHQRKALSQILNLFDNKKELGKPLVTFYEDLSTNFFMQNTRLIDEIGVNAGNYRHVVTSQACWLEAKNHCLLY